MDTKYYRVVALLCGVMIAMLADGGSVVGQQSPEMQVVAVIDAYHAALAAGDSVTALRSAILLRT